MEERQFLHRLCTTALQVDVSIQFADIIDSNGELLVGKSRIYVIIPISQKGKLLVLPLEIPTIMVTTF